ncbi:MAG: CBS domain-containing protein [Sulfuricaulis sp.]
MNIDYSPLPTRMLQAGASFHKPSQTLPQRVTMESPGVDVMTDLTRIVPVTIGPDATIDEANQAMIRRGVRLLLVINDNQVILGLITTTDIQGEKPLKFIQEHRVTRSEILVRDIMTPQERLEAIRYQDVLSGTVGQVVATLKQSGHRHTLVTDHSGDSDRHMVRGIFSLSQIARQIGVPLPMTKIAKTFAEIEGMLAH